MQQNEDVGLIATLMPNRTRARLVRATAWFCLAISLLFGAPLAKPVFNDLHARWRWPVADGVVRGYQQKSAEVHASGTRSTGGASWTVYWIEFEVGLDIPAEHCRTGTIVGGRAPLACVGTIRTLGTNSWTEAQSWVARHPPNSHQRFLYDPSGEDLRFANESVWNLYPWGKMALFCTMILFSALFVNTAEHRVRQLNALPDDYDSAPPQAEEPDPNQPVELKLS